jgi:DNA-binding XRE family transcriptional regulator
MNEFSTYIKQLRDGAKTEWFAGEIGITQSCLSHLESGRWNPSLKTLKGVSRITGRSIDDLVKTFNL